ncbi:unnamed protein product [Macrosiphum euphorbiae]|nr:unnamed protein product [Macrosiphum euphorbiae]
MRTVSNYNGVKFRSHFRLSRSSVEILSSKIINRYEGNYILGQKRISFYRALLMTLWYLSNNETFRQLGDRFDVACGNACRTVHYLIDIICTVCDDFIIWPKGSNLINVANSFNTLRVNNFPNVIGTIDGCHI